MHVELQLEVPAVTLHWTGAPPMSKRARGGDPDRVVLNVGGTEFATSRSTLEPCSSYFARRFSEEWAGGAAGEIFLDLDADCFRVLLSCMRRRSALLPAADLDLCARVLLDAQYLGIDFLLDEVKATVQRHTHPADASRHTAEAFDAEHTPDLLEAIKAGVLPARFFSPPPKRAKTIKQLVASRGRRLMFNHPTPPDGLVMEWSRPVACLALVEDADGNTTVEAVLEDGHIEETGEMHDDFSDPTLRLQSDYRTSTSTPRKATSIR